MEDRIARLETTVSELRGLAVALQDRIASLEARALAGTPAAPLASGDAATSPASTGPAGSAARRDPYDPIALLSLVGRLFLVLAGGFFLRAMTDEGLLVPQLGLSVGFAYAMIWLVMADRTAGRQQVPSAVFHALGAALIAYPLLDEAVTKFKVLGGTSSAVAVAVLTIAMLFVAAHRRLRAVGWIAVCGVLTTSFALLMQTGVVAPFTLVLIAFGVATLWLGYVFDWWGMRWPAALAADFAVVGVTLRVLAPEQHDLPQVAILMQLLLLGGYVVSIAIQVLIRGRNVVAFEVAQTAAALVVGFGGALYLSQATGILPSAVGVMSLVAGVASYAVAVVFLDRRSDNGRNVYYYTTLGLVHVMAGFALTVGDAAMSTVFAGLAVVAAALWSRFGRSFMLVHSAAYLVAASVVSGTLSYGAVVMMASVPASWETPTFVMSMVLAAAAASAFLSAARRNATGDAIAGVFRLVIILILLAAGAALVTGYVAPATGRAGEGVVAVGVLATITTVVLALVTLFAAWLGRRPKFREWSWLVYPLLVAIGVKMVLEDFKFSRPATLFIAMALYGTALIVAPRLRRTAAKATDEASA